jgi:hypothetical protein
LAHSLAHESSKRGSESARTITSGSLPHESAMVLVSNPGLVQFRVTVGRVSMGGLGFF